MGARGVAGAHSGDPAPSPSSPLTRFGDLSRNKAGEVLGVGAGIETTNETGIQ